MYSVQWFATDYRVHGGINKNGCLHIVYSQFTWFIYRITWSNANTATTTRDTRAISYGVEAMPEWRGNVMEYKKKFIVFFLFN